MIETMFCAACYLAGIERLCRGYVITQRNRDGTVLRRRYVPPLDARVAAEVRQAAAGHLAARGDSPDTARHANHQAAA